MEWDVLYTFTVCVLRQELTRLQFLSVNRKKTTGFDIWELYGCNNKINCIGILASPCCSSVNLMTIFNSTVMVVIKHHKFALIFILINCRYLYNRYSSHYHKALLNIPFKTLFSVQLKVWVVCPNYFTGCEGKKNATKQSFKNCRSSFLRCHSQNIFITVFTIVVAVA